MNILILVLPILSNALPVPDALPWYLVPVTDSNVSSGEQSPPKFSTLTNSASRAFESVGESIDKEVTSMEENVSDGAKRATEGARKAVQELVTLENQGKKAATDAVSSIQSHVENAFSSISNATVTAYEIAAQGTANFTNRVKLSTESAFSSLSTSVKDASSEAKNFLSSTWDSVPNWWTSLEEEVRDFIHLALKVLDIVIGIAVFCFFIWVITKVRKVYHFITKFTNIPEEIELRNHH